jgi:hypothetical protein
MCPQLSVLALFHPEPLKIYCLEYAELYRSISKTGRRISKCNVKSSATLNTILLPSNLKRITPATFWNGKELNLEVPVVDLAPKPLLSQPSQPSHIIAPQGSWKIEI